MLRGGIRAVEEERSQSQNKEKADKPPDKDTIKQQYNTKTPLKQTNVS